MREVETPVGLARVTVRRARGASRLLVLGHGAGGTSWSADILAVTEAAVADGWVVALVEQPWRVAGRRVAFPPATLDRAWVPVLAALTRGRGRLPRPLVVGGRSAGARVACRTAAEVGADAVLCLSFPLHPPGRPEASRAEELRAPLRHGTPVRVVQGEADPFGSPAEVARVLSGEWLPPGEPGPVVLTVPGGHTLARPLPVVAAVRAALDGIVG